MARKHYDYSGENTASIKSHSITKHDILVKYIIRYLEQRTLGLHGDANFKLTLIDGFAGSGKYFLNGNSKDIVHGSPLKMLSAVKEADYLINKNKDKKIKLDIEYIFVDSDANAISFLRKNLITEGYELQLDKSIFLLTGDFNNHCSKIIERIQIRTPKAGKALFFLDQYGYSDVPKQTIKNIFIGLNQAEIILNFHVSSFATYVTDDLVDAVSNSVGIDLKTRLQGKSIEEIKANDSDWRKFIQSTLYASLVEGCGASYFTPFFIKGEGGGHGEYWLVHLSQQHRAQDVMKQIHWENHNSFIHYGGAGLDMLSPQVMGFFQEFDGGFNFDSQAKEKSTELLTDQLLVKIQNHKEALTFGGLYANTCNQTPASASIYKDVLENLIGQKEIIIITKDGAQKNVSANIVDSDSIVINKQQKLTFT